MKLALLVEIMFPNYYRRVWNEEFTVKMEKTRQELYEEFPDTPEIVDKYVRKAYEKWLK